MSSLGTARTLRTRRTHRRIVAVAALTGVSLVGLAGRLLAVQVLGHERYRATWSRQVRVRIEEPAERGRIRFRGGETGALSRQRAPSVFADPTEVGDPDAAAPLLAEALGLPASEVREKLGRPGRFAWLARRVSAGERGAVVALGLRGVGIRDEAERVYPCGSLAAHLIGFVGADHVGLEGIEAAFERVLAGRPGFRVLARDALGRMAVEPEAPREPALPGCDVLLSVDAAAQRVAEEELASAVARWRAASACALVLDVPTGEVRAWAVVPTFDPDDAARTPPESRRNRALTDPIEPGSVFKAFTVGTALAQGAVAPETRLDCGGGEWAYRGRRLHDFHRYGTLTVEEILVKSSNIGAARATLALGGTGGDPESREARAWARLAPALGAFGFGAPTGVGIPGEEPGRIGGDPREGWKWSYHTLLSVSFGHEVLVTPLQLAAAMNAIANDGLWVPPRVVRRVEGRDGAPVPGPEPPASRRAMPPEAAARLRTILRRVVESGTGKAARTPGLDLGGKTGTTKKVEGGAFVSDRSLCSFAGFGPVERPALTVLVCVDEPREGTREEQTGGRVAAPVASRILARLLGTDPAADPRRKAR